MYNNDLNKSYWKNDIFDKSVRKKILKIVEDFLISSESDFNVEDIKLTGSLANYTYNKFSDLDVHIVVDFDGINADKKLVKEALDGKRFVWNLKHNIFIRGHEVELYFEDKNEKRSVDRAEYSILFNEWIKKPEFKPPVNVDMNEVAQKVFYITDLVNRMLQKLKESSDKKEIKLIYNKSKKLKDKIIKVRAEALQKSGEFALENLIFKKLRNNGMVEKIIDIINGSYDKFFTENLSFNKIVSLITK